MLTESSLTLYVSCSLLGLFRAISGLESWTGAFMIYVSSMYVCNYADTITVCMNIIGRAQR